MAAGAALGEPDALLEAHLGLSVFYLVLTAANALTGHMHAPEVGNLIRNAALLMIVGTANDVLVLAGGASAASYASRGQVRTAALAIKLAEAAHIADRRGHQPVLLLDDVLSELDAARRAHVLSVISGYEQCIISTADPGSIESRFPAGMARFVVERGRVTRE